VKNRIEHPMPGLVGSREACGVIFEGASTARARKSRDWIEEFPHLASAACQE